MFSASTKGAKSSATLYSIIETAKANGLIVEKYLVYLMNELSNIDTKNSENLIHILPWSDKIPQELKIQILAKTK